jgi:hypothetical protein
MKKDIPDLDKGPAKRLQSSWIQIHSRIQVNPLLVCMPMGQYCYNSLQRLSNNFIRGRYSIPVPWQVATLSDIPSYFYSLANQLDTFAEGCQPPTPSGERASGYLGWCLFNFKNKVAYEITY